MVSLLKNGTNNTFTLNAHTTTIVLIVGLTVERILMNREYFTEDQKLGKISNPRWNKDEQTIIHRILLSKGYLVNCVSRVGCDRKYHDAWQINREDVPRLIEQLFRQRLTVEIQAEGSYKASINFIYDYHASTIIEAVKRFHKNKGDAL